MAVQASPRPDAARGPHSTAVPSRDRMQPSASLRTAEGRGATRWRRAGTLLAVLLLALVPLIAPADARLRWDAEARRALAAGRPMPELRERSPGTDGAANPGVGAQHGIRARQDDDDDDDDELGDEEDEKDEEADDEEESEDADEEAGEDDSTSDDAGPDDEEDAEDGADEEAESDEREEEPADVSGEDENESAEDMNEPVAQDGGEEEAEEDEAGSAEEPDDVAEEEEGGQEGDEAAEQEDSEDLAGPEEAEDLAEPEDSEDSEDSKEPEESTEPEESDDDQAAGDDSEGEQEPGEGGESEQGEGAESDNTEVDEDEESGDDDDDQEESEQEDSEDEEFSEADESLASVLGVEPDRAVELKSAAEQAGFKVAHCAHRTALEAELKVDDSKLVHSACTGVAPDDDPEGAVIFLPDLAQAKEIAGMLPEELAPALNCAQSTLEKLDLPAGVKVAIGVGPDRGNETPQPEAPAPHARRRLEKRDGYASKCQIRISLRPNAGFEYLNLRGIRLLDRTEQPIQVLESDISFGQQGIEAWANCFNGGPGCHSAMSPQDDYPWFSASFDCARGLTKITVLNREHDCCRNRINAYMLVLYGRAGTRIEQWYFDGGFPEYSFPVNVDYCTARIATRPGAWDSLHLREFAVEMYAPYQSNHKPPIIGHVSSNAEPFWNCYDGNLENFCHTTKWDPLPSATLQYWCGAVGTSNSGWSGVFVHLFNRIDCCSERIMNFQLELLDRGGVPLGPNHGIANSNAYIQFNQAYPWKRCGIHIFTKPGVPAEYLHLREVKIFARTGQVPANQLDYWMSSELPNDPVSRCFDGAEGPTASYCHTAGGDGNPSLTVRYDCAIDVDYVEIHNRVDCCKQRITNFALTFFDAFGAIRTPYDFQYAIDAFRISPWEPSWCSVRVVLKSGANPRSLALREMRLINEDGRALHVSELQIAISSEWPTLGVGYCFDGDMGTICVSKEDDKNPKLAVRYDCSRKKLQRVEVYNRIDCPAAWDCPGALNSYRLEFLDPTGSELRAPYDFEGGRGEYFVPAQYAMCTVQIRMNPGERSGEFLNLRQVKLFDQNGQIPSSELLTALAPDWPAEYPVGRCFDGSTALDNMCHTGSSTEASLTIRYNCAMRQLSRVEVFNRWDSCGALCADRLNKFQLEFLRPDGKPFRFPYHFAGGRQLYNVGEKCAIRFVPPSEKPELRLRELRLFGTDNALFPPSDLVFGADWRACFDGNDNTQCTIPASAADETYVVRYPCTKTVLTRVEVVPAEGDSSITRFQLEFLDAAMFPSREPSLFKTWKALYTITAGSTANIAAASDLEAEFNAARTAAEAKPVAETPASLQVAFEKNKLDWPTLKKDTACPGGYSPFGSKERGGFCCSGDVSHDGLQCTGGDYCGFPGTPRPPDAKWKTCRTTSKIVCPASFAAFGDYLGGFCCKGKIAADGSSCDGESCRIQGNNRTESVPLCRSGVPAAEPLTVEADLRAAKDLPPAHPKPSGPVDEKEVFNYVCASGTSPYGTGFCCGGEVSADGAKCLSGASCAFPRNADNQTAACRDGQRYICPRGSVPYNDARGGFCCSGRVKKGDLSCGGSSCAFTTNGRPQGQPFCDGSIVRDVSVLEDASAVKVSSPPPEVVPGDSEPSPGVDVGHLALSCPGLPSHGFNRRLSIRLAGAVPWSKALPLANLLLNNNPFELPDGMGKLSDVAKIVHVAMDFDALPAIAAANVIIQVPNVTVSHDFGLVDITGNLAYGSESGASFDLSGSGRLPGLASGVPFQMALLTDGDMIPLTLATQDRPLTLNSMLAGMRMQSAYGDLPQVPLLSSKLAEFLQIQIKNVVLFFCKPGAKSRGCVPRASINILVPSSLLSFDNSLLPVSLNDALLTVSMVDVFSSSRSLEFRITGKWNVAGVPLVLTVMRAPSEEQLDLTDYSGTDDQPSRRPRLAAREHVLDQDDSESDRDVELDADRGVVDDAVGSDRVAEDVVGLSGMPSIEVAGDDGLSDALPATDDSWVQFPDLSHTFSAGAGFFDVPLAHVNHHLYRTHLERRGLDPALAHRRHLLRNETTRTLQRREAKDESGAAHSKSRTVLAKARPTAARRVAKSPKRKPGVRVPKGSSGMWVVSAVAPSLQLGKLLDALSAKILPSGEVSDVVRSTGLDDFEIKDFGLMLVLGQKELFLRLSGSMDRLPGEPRVQIVVKREVGGSFEGAIALGAKGEIFSETMRKFVPGFELPGLDLVASGLTMGIIISSKTMELTNSALALYSPLDYIGSIHRGLELNLRMGLPKTCSGFCDVMKQLLGPDVGLQVMVIVDSSSVVLGAGVTDVKITDGLTLQSVKFEASFSKSAGAMMKLIGTLMLDVDSSQPPLIFDAYVGVKGASVLLGGKMKGIWRKAFGWDRLAVGNLVLEVGITAALGAPSILIGGEVAIGKNCYTSSDTFDLSNNKCFGGAVYIGTDPVNPQSNWFAGELNNVDLRHIIGAFTDNEPDESVFPKPLLNSGFPGKLQVSYCPAGGCEVPGHSFGMGFYLNGTINIFDVTARAEILVYPSKQIKLDFELSPLNLANGLIVAYYSKEDSSRGPRLKLDIEYARMDKATLLLNGYVKVFLFEVEAAIEISPTHYKIEFEASYFAFHASFLLQAQIGARLAFRMQAEFSMSHFQAFVDAVVKAVEGWAEDASKVMGKAKAGVESAQKKVNEVKNSVCEFRDRCQAAADAVKCKRRIKKRGLEGGQAGNRRSDRRMLGKRTSKGLDNRSEGGHHLEKRLGIIKSSFEKAFNWVKNAAITVAKGVASAARWAADQAVNAGNAIKSAAEDVGKFVKDTAVKAADWTAKTATRVANEIKNGVCAGWEMASGAIIDGACKAACEVAKAGLDIANGVLAAANAVVTGIDMAIQAAATIFKEIAKKIAEQIQIRRVSIAADVSADLKAGMMGGSVGVQIEAKLFGKEIDVGFTIDFNDIIRSAGKFFSEHVKEFAVDFAKSKLGISWREKRRLLAAREAAPSGAIPMSKLPWMPGFKEGFDQGPPPGQPGGEDNDFRIKFGESLYLSCATTIGAFSRKGAPCVFADKARATMFMSAPEPSGKQSFRAGKYCLAVDRSSNVVLTPCLADQPNGVWIYDAVTGQLSSKGAGVARAADAGSAITRADIEFASLASDGKCMTVTKGKKARVTRCYGLGDKPADLKVQRFTMRINVESINLGDLVTFHAVGLYERSYIAADPADGSVSLRPGDLDDQQADNLAAFRVVEPLCGANYHFTLESVARPGFYLSSAPGDRPGLVLTDKPAGRDHACWLPTPGPARPKYASGCPGIIFGLRSRGVRGTFLRATEKGGLVLSGAPDEFMLSCWRPVPPLGAPSAANPFPGGGGEAEEDAMGGVQEEDIAAGGMEDETSGEDGEFGGRRLDPRREL